VPISGRARDSTVYEKEISYVPVSGHGLVIRYFSVKKERSAAFLANMMLLNFSTDNPRFRRINAYDVIRSL
jgi:hypothetical protein